MSETETVHRQKQPVRKGRQVRKEKRSTNGHSEQVSFRHSSDCARLERTRTAKLAHRAAGMDRSEEHTSELQSLMRTSYDVFCLKKKTLVTNTDILISALKTTEQKNKQN